MPNISQVENSISCKHQSFVALEKDDDLTTSLGLGEVLKKVTEYGLWSLECCEFK
jgi:hypothetical protein